MFQLTKGELEIWKSQFVISSGGQDILHDQNDINESTRMQLENITLALSELQAKKPSQKPRRRIGFIQDEDK